MVINSPVQDITTKPYHIGIYFVWKCKPLIGEVMIPAYFNGIDWCLPAYTGGEKQAIAQSDNVLKGTTFYWYGVINVKE